MTDCDVLDVIRRYEYKSIATICMIPNQSCACQGSKFPGSFSNTENLGEFEYTLLGFEYTLLGQATAGHRVLVIIPLLSISINNIETTAESRLHSTYNESNTRVLRIFSPDCHGCIAVQYFPRRFAVAEV